MSALDTGRVHFVGIGGVGMSAIAKVLVERGVEVSGSDLKRSRALTMLEVVGASVAIGHDASLVEGADAVVVSSAIPKGNPEFARAVELDIPVLTRGQALAALLRNMRSIVVAGTHGKTTTTSMIVTVLRSTGLDPTYLVGAGLNDSGTNARAGHDDLAVAESDESDGSFLLLAPHIAVVTNVEADHLDHWRSLDAIREAFRAFARGTAAGGSLVVPHHEREMFSDLELPTVTFGDGGDVTARDVAATRSGMEFTLAVGGKEAGVVLSAPGEHNVLNALASAGACFHAGLELDDIARGLSEFRGVERRFHLRGSVGGISVVDDYAHHPTEIKATLRAARSAGSQRLVAVFQPHRYSRTASFYRDFGRSFDDAARIVVTDVYGAGERPVPGVSGKLIADAVCERLPGRPVAYLPHRADVVGYLRGTLRPGDMVLTLGAGDITSLGEELLGKLEARDAG